MTHDMATANARLDYIATLEDGWLDGEGKKIEQKNIDNARMFLEKLGPEPWGIFPNEEGGISLEDISTESSVAVMIDFNESPEGSFSGFIFDMDKA